MPFPGKAQLFRGLSPWPWDTEVPGSIPAESAVLHR